VNASFRCIQSIQSIWRHGCLLVATSSSCTHSSASLVLLATPHHSKHSKHLESWVLAGCHQLQLHSLECLPGAVGHTPPAGEGLGRNRQGISTPLVMQKTNARSGGAAPRGWGAMQDPTALCSQLGVCHSRLGCQFRIDEVHILGPCAVTSTPPPLHPPLPAPPPF